MMNFNDFISLAFVGFVLCMLISILFQSILLIFDDWLTHRHLPVELDEEAELKINFKKDD